MGLLSSSRFYDMSNHYHSPSTIEVNIKENRAPTDDSIRLADEYKDRAEERLMEIYKINYNSVECVVFAFSDVYMIEGADSIRYLLKFKLNGTEYMEKFELDTFELRMKGEHIEQAIINEVAKIIASRITQTLLTGMTYEKIIPQRLNRYTH